MSITTSLIAANLFSIIGLIIIYWFTYIHYKERFIAFWALSWSFYAINSFIILLNLYTNSSAFIEVLGIVCLPPSGFFLLWGTYLFLNRSFSHIWFYATGISMIWTIIFTLYPTSSIVINLPAHLCMAFTCIWTGKSLLCSARTKDISSLMSGWSFIVLGFCKLLFPLDHLNTLSFILVSLIAYVLSVSILLLYTKTTLQSLNESRDRFRAITEHAFDLICEVDSSGRLLYLSPNFEIVLGFSTDDLIHTKISNLIHPDDFPVVAEYFTNGFHPKKHFQTVYRFIDNNSNWHWFESTGKRYYAAEHELHTVIVSRDISERKKQEDALLIQRTYFEQLFENSPNGILVLDTNNHILKANKAITEMFGYKHEDVINRHLHDIIVPNGYLEEAVQASETVLNGQIFDCETVRKCQDGSLLDVHILGYPIIVDNNHLAICGIYSDISSRKKAEKQLQFLSLHDPLTGLYNRTFFEHELSTLQSEQIVPLGLIVCDLDGLKLVNDTLGHETGDTLLARAAEVIQNSFRSSDHISRIGGDEFAIVLPLVDEQQLEFAYARLNTAISEYNLKHPDLFLSISVGTAVRYIPEITTIDLFKEADNNMYREKLHRSQSTRSSIVNTLMKALEERDFITEGHAERLKDLVEGVARNIGLPERTVSNLRLLASFHDIGKVGVPDRILFKPGPLSPEERSEMQRHCEIGYRIARSAPDLSHIADWILYHHEWWNGQGYPCGLAGEDIPLECRILAIADAYDTMTSNRPYRKAISHTEAINELIRCSGSQFDPDLLKQFIDYFNSRDFFISEMLESE